ncbi:hypothetical protein KW076_05830 [Micrococcus porci]|uniref:hypothetical protein n=1 Tax=Micrococcus porci TaxID=2856555 RepID=UPI001CC9964C|nr:hypothetical protein [Micrococcus porci]UBH25694.1 hypothetical protein KW076_05830 [Micrococcus porci]
MAEDAPALLAGRDPLAAVEALLAAARDDAALPLPAGSDAPSLRERALEALLREDPASAARAAEDGLDAPGGQDPALRLALLRLRATAAAHAGDEPALEEWTARRADLLRRLGRPRQADLEVQLGASLLREPDAFEATVLAGVAEDERGRITADPAALEDTVLPDALLALCAQRVQAHDLDAALEAAEEALAVIRAQETAGVVLGEAAEPHALLMLARLHLWREEHRASDDAARAVLARPCAAVVRASATLVRALAAHGQDRPEAALDFALRAAEAMSRAGLRRGAASAAALVGRVAGARADRQDLAVAAWELSCVHAEKAEAPEAPSLAYWWAHQLLIAGRAEEAEPVLTALVRREAAAGDEAAQARALVDLGHACHELDRPSEALPLWREAAELFTRRGHHADAAHTLLAAGALCHRDPHDAAHAGALDLFEQAVDAARRSEGDSAVLASALHALGYLRCETGRGDGLELIDEAIALAEGSGAAWQKADYLDTRARSLWALHRGDDAVSAALTSADLFTDAGDPSGAAQAELFAAHVVAEDGRPEQAATLFRLVSESTHSDLVRLGALTGLQQCLAALGEHAEADRVRADADAVRRALGGRD